jgi:hypothetical protein
MSGLRRLLSFRAICCPRSGDCKWSAEVDCDNGEGVTVLRRVWPAVMLDRRERGLVGVCKR